ncbi:MAG: restriction endonuclease subunit S [Lachnospiraceae bacterium]|nr:restriction endonuclease subunit S [Lachnospiraceae bacterium]
MLKYRFKQDNGSEYPDWDNFTLDKCCNCFDSKRIPISEQNRIKGSYPYYGANGIQDYVNDYIFDGEYMLLAEDGGHYKEYKTRPIAQYVTGKFWVNNHAHILQSKDEFYNKFVFYCLEHKNIIPVVKGSTRGKLNQSDMWKIEISIPINYDEQQKIADFLSAVDNQINIQRQRVEIMETQKKGLLDKVFSQELRFKQDDGSDYPNWENECLGHLCTIGDGLHGTPNFDKTGKYYFINGNNLSNKKIVFTNDTDKVNEVMYEKHKIDIPIDTVMMSINGTIGNTALYNNEPVILGKSVAYFIIKDSSKLVSRFLIQFLITDLAKKLYRGNMPGTTIKNLGLTTLRNLWFKKPCPEEQQKIANFFTAIDNQIDIEKQRLTTMETIKKGLLQQMFC